MVLVNIGCGATFHHSWMNFDINPVSPEVRKLDLRQGLPLPDSCADACYCSHVLEHLSLAEANWLLLEVRRILRPGGVVRIVVPDLEGIVRAYLLELENAERDDGPAAARYDWMVLELLDQISRRTCGGEMSRFLRACPLDVRTFVVSRIGMEAVSLWAADRNKRPLLARLSSKGLRWYVDTARYSALVLLAVLVGGSKGRRAVRTGWFLECGEAHRWMYDRRSLRLSLLGAGFTDVNVCRPSESMIQGFNEYGLDMCGDQVRKPDSIFVEAITK